MTEFLVSFELWTILYILILVPSCTFLIVFAYRIAKSLEIGLLERWNRRIVNQNKKVIMENIRVSNELIDTQIQLRKELEMTKKELQRND